MRTYVKIALGLVFLSGCWLGLLTEFVGSSEHTHTLENSVKELRVNIVREVSSEASGEEHKVTTDCSGVLKVVDEDMLRDLNWFLAKRLPASIEYDKDSRQISSVSSAPTDVVIMAASAQSSEDQVTVQLMKRPTLLFLDKKNPRFTALYDLLDNARREKKPIAIGVLPGGKLIEDVRVNDWK